MSPRVLRRIAAVLVLALAAWGGLALLARGRTDRAAGLALPALAPDQVDLVRLGRAPDTLRLARSGAGWTVNGVPAAEPLVRAFLQAASDSTVASELIARSAGPHQRLGVDSAQARRLTISGGGTTLLDLYVGNRGPEFEGFYVRPADGDAVHLLRGDFAEALGRGLDEWRDRVILRRDPGEIGGVMVRRGRAGYTVARGASGWTIAGAPADSARVARFLAQFADVRASGFPEPGAADSIPFDPAEREVALLAPDGRTLEHFTLDSAERGFWMRNAAGVVYRIDRATADRITPAAEAFR